jgi:mRNA interferase RelE/StbE
VSFSERGKRDSRRQHSGYTIARMAFEIVLAPQAVASLRALPVPVRTGVKEAIRRHLTHEPTKVSKSRIKRLRGLSRPQYRLRVDDFGVFYDVTETQVQVLAVVTKADAQAWLDEEGTSEEGPARGRSGSGQG